MNLQDNAYWKLWDSETGRKCIDLKLTCSSSVSSWKWKVLLKPVGINEIEWTWGFWGCISLLFHLGSLNTATESLWVNAVDHETARCLRLQKYGPPRETGENPWLNCDILYLWTRQEPLLIPSISKTHAFKGLHIHQQNAPKSRCGHGLPWSHFVFCCTFEFTWNIFNFSIISAFPRLVK